MGYDSNFNLSILRCRNKKEGRNIIRDIEKKSGEVFNDVSADSASIYDTHWYNAVDDIAAVAKKYPSAIIELDREGENRDDNERTRFHGEKRETVTLVQRWPPFREIVLDTDRETSEKLYVATVIEVDESGDVFTSIHTAKNPQEVADEVVRHLETEIGEREMELEFSPGDILLAVIHGNETSGPECIEASDRDVTFFIATAVR